MAASLLSLGHLLLQLHGVSAGIEEARSVCLCPTYFALAPQAATRLMSHGFDMSLYWRVNDTREGETRAVAEYIDEHRDTQSLRVCKTRYPGWLSVRCLSFAQYFYRC